MKTDYDLLLKQYENLLTLLQLDEREVSNEMVQVIKDDIEDILIEQGKASQIQPNLFGCIGYQIDDLD